jgi:hypothetical protein
VQRTIYFDPSLSISSLGLASELVCTVVSISPITV